MVLHDNGYVNNIIKVTIMQTDKPVKRTRKTPEQRIAEAQAALRRARDAQRRNETRQKIILGALATEWLKNDSAASQSFLQHLSDVSIRERDIEVIRPVLSELRQGSQSDVQQ